MSKNLTRKGLALGAAFALVATAVVSTPAMAADGVVLKANTGTTLAAPVTETLTLNASLVAGLPAANIQQLKYKVVTDGSYVLKAVAKSAGTTTNNTFYTNADGRSYVGPFADANTTPTDFTDDTGYRAAGVSTSKVLTPATTPTTTAINTLALSVDALADATTATTGVAPSATTATKTATVTAWIDSNNDSVVDAGESQQVVTVSFIKYSEITATTTITSPVQGDTTATATVVFNNVNNEQLDAAEVGAGFTKGDDTALDASASKVVKTSVDWDATNGYFKYTTDTIAALVKAQAVKVQPLMKNTGVGTDATAKVGTAVTAVIATRVALTVTGASVPSITANSANASLLNSSFSVKATVKDGSTPAAAVAGAAVTATVTTNATLSATAGSVVSLAVAGSTYTAKSALPGAGSVAKLALTTDANGDVVVPLATSGYTAGQTVTVTFVTENLTGSVTSTQTAATYTATKAAFVTTTDDASVGVPVVVYDQFGGRPANDYDVRAVFATSGQSPAATTATSTNVALVGGAATLVLTDNGTGVGVNVYNVTIVKRAAGGGFGDALTGISSTTLDVHVKTAASLVAATVTSTGTQNSTTKVYAIAGPVALSLVDTAAYDNTTVLGTAPSTFTTPLGAGQNITGTVSTVASSTVVAAVVPGASVTISGAGLQFGDGVKYTVGSITVVANTSGVYTANVYSNKAGKQTLTITSGAASATTTVTFAVAAGNTGAVLTITAPDYVAAGSTFSATALLVDKYGNVVTTTGVAGTFSFSAVSPGFQVGTNPTATDADGVAKLAYFLGNNDSGTIGLTAVYDIDGSATTTTDRFTVTKTVTIGVAPVMATEKVNVGSFKGYVALYAKGYMGMKMSAIVAGKWIVVASLATDFERVVRYTGAGYDIVATIYIDGEMIDTFNVTTK
jgi:hypothetical protein